MTVAAPSSLPMVLTEVEVTAVSRLSPSFVRVTLAGAGLGDVGVDGSWWDQRFKLIVPASSGALTSVADADETWLSTWLERPVEERGHMRTYTIRSLVGAGDDTRLVVDIVVHPGAVGPGSDWAASCSVGSRAVALLPRRGLPFGGIEFAPPAASPLLLVGDESAVPAICAIVEQLPASAVGRAFLEVPTAEDVLPVTGESGVEVTWLVRQSGEVGSVLHPEVLAYLGAGPLALERPVEIDPDLWETPVWSSSGETFSPSPAPDGSLYAWIAGESGMVTALRRHLVRELGFDRSQVAFMGYWRRGVAMRS